MTCDQVWTGIIIPLIAAIIGGGITMWGVILTIKREKQKDDENRILAVKPWIFSYESIRSFNADEVNIIHLSVKEKLDEQNTELFDIIIKNTDNGIGIVEKFVTENNTYYPIVGRVIEKNTTVILRVHWNGNENLRKMRLFIQDVYQNRYCYEVTQSSEEIRGGYYIKEITQ